MKPSIGRIVHFVWGATHFPAIVINVRSDETVNLEPFVDRPDAPTGAQLEVMHNEQAQHNTWHWPERE